MKLSISLIVKNEESNLEKCLISLVPLMSKITSELIIIDTGSTDKTISIAKGYTDKVFDFKWENDFSAARNYGISKASGDWFMYLDADECLDSNFTELLDFLSNPNSLKNWGSARLKLRNYTDSTLSAYTESHNLRICNMTKGVVKFKGAIHESLPEINPCKTINTYLDHYGYIADLKSMEEKHKRNMPALLKAYKAEGPSPRLLAHLFYSCSSKEKEKYLTEWYTMARQIPNDLYSLPVYSALIQTLLDGNCTEDALFYVDEYIKYYGDGNTTITTMSVIALGINGLIKLGNYDNAETFYDVYSSLWDEFSAGKTSTNELSTCVVFFGTSNFDYCALSLLVASVISDKQKAKQILSKINDIPPILRNQYDTISKAITE